MAADDRIIQLDVTLERRDLVSAALFMARRRLAVGLCVLAAVAAAFLITFVYIGEQAMLWELSPLFVGLPLVATVGQLARLNAEAKKYLSGLTEAQKSAHYIFQSNADGFGVLCGGNSAHVTWDGLHKVVERPLYYLIYLNASDARILPKRGIRLEDETVLREILTSSLGDRAILAGG